MVKILIVEDEKSLNQLMSTSLQTVGYEVFQAFYGMEAIKLIEKHPFDLVLLDIHLPDINGFNLIKSFQGIPVIYVTAQDQVDNRVKGLNLGAEDYIIKPFALEELIARVQVVLRRYHSQNKVFELEDLAVDLDMKKVTYQDRLIELTPQEFSLLDVFIQHRNMALSREQLIELAWGLDFNGENRTVDVHIRRLRQKLHLEAYLKTVYKLGYRLEVS